MKRDDKIYVGKILAAGFVPLIPTSTQYCHKLWLTQHCLIDHSNFLIYTPTSYKFQLFYFAGFLFDLGLGAPLNWRSGHPTKFLLLTAFRPTLWFNTIFGSPTRTLSGLFKISPIRAQSQGGKKAINVLMTSCLAGRGSLSS